MYGQIHVCIRSLVLDKFGEHKWKEILERSGCDAIDHFMTFKRYDDTTTISLVNAAAEILSVPVDAVFELFGDYFFNYCLQHGYDKMLRTLGDNIESFIQNLDSLHSLLSMTYTNIDAPSFRCERSTEGLILHYYSSRPGLYPIVVGLVKAVGRELYGQSVSLQLVENNVEKMRGDKTICHCVFVVTIEKSESSPSLHQEVALYARQSYSLIPDEPIVSPRMLSNIFPYLLVFDTSLVVKQCGARIAENAHLTDQITKLGDLFELAQPQMPLTFHYILRFCNATFILESKTLQCTSERGIPFQQSRLTLKGQMIWLEDVDHMLFIGSPRLTSLNDLQERNLFLSDIPLYDVTRELVLLNQQRLAELDVSKKLDETTAELKKTSQELEIEKTKTDMLLYQMLPVKVADQLREGSHADAEKFEHVTILFSDIVTFTAIAAAVQPIQVVALLNEVYSRFDHLTNVHGVYKVETIGDAYMVVGGVPEASPRHASAVADFSLDMVLRAREVHSPATGQPLQIRVGLHSGPVVAGVVGEKMPRYCLFGDTVNTASRMESHGLPDRIHVSQQTYCHLQNDYNFEERGEMEIKGKGRMTTFFLLAKDERRTPCQKEQSNGVKMDDTNQAGNEHQSLGDCEGSRSDSNSVKPPAKVLKRKASSSICSIA